MGKINTSTALICPFFNYCIEISHRAEHARGVDWLTYIMYAVSTLVIDHLKKEKMMRKFLKMERNNATYALMYLVRACTLSLLYEISDANMLEIER
jgi:hypothetical protein